MEYFWQKISFGKSRSCPHRSNNLFRLKRLSKLRLIVIQVVSYSCNSTRHQLFMQEKFFKNEISENISQKIHGP